MTSHKLCCGPGSETASAKAAMLQYAADCDEYFLKLQYVFHRALGGRAETRPYGQGLVEKTPDGAVGQSGRPPGSIFETKFSRPENATIRIRLPVSEMSIRLSTPKMMSDSLEPGACNSGLRQPLAYAAFFFALISLRLIRHSAIWIAFSAAPLRRLSDTHHSTRPFSTVLSSRMRLI